MIKGFMVPLRQIFKRKVTTQYPEQKRSSRSASRPPRAQPLPGRMEKCIGCELCAGVCPARCIYVRGKENPPDAPVSPGERYGFIYEINLLRCIFCGLCEEACPTEAITMTQLFEMSVTNRNDAIYTRSELLMNPDGTVPHPQPDSILVDKGELRLADGWMRATASSGRAAYEGVIAWTATAGVGTRPAELGQSRQPTADSQQQETDTGDGRRATGDETDHG
jgi:NADH-quinone oxidoreductase subunit I